MTNQQICTEGNMIDTKTYLTENDISEKVQELGAQITEFYKGQELVVVCVLKGAFIFTADLIRHISLPLSVEFIAVQSYDKTESTGTVQITQDLTSPIDGKDVLLVEDIIDTGVTSKYLLDLLSLHKPKSLKLCSLLHKPSKTKVDIPIDFLGFTIPDAFVVGYGLDLDQKYRNYPFIATSD